jgi:hypothetical protein
MRISVDGAMPKWREEVKTLPGGGALRHKFRRSSCDLFAGDVKIFCQRGDGLDCDHEQDVACADAAGLVSC